MHELSHLLDQLGFGAAKEPICDMIMDLERENMTVPQLERAIHHILGLHGFEPCADALVSALRELNFAGLSAPPAMSMPHGEGKAAGE